jgi:hypothetical protein
MQVDRRKVACSPAPNARPPTYLRLPAPRGRRRPGHRLPKPHGGPVLYERAIPHAQRLHRGSKRAASCRTTPRGPASHLRSPPPARRSRCARAGPCIACHPPIKTHVRRGLPRLPNVRVSATDGAPVAFHRHSFESIPAETTRPSGACATSVTHSVCPYVFVYRVRRRRSSPPAPRRSNSTRPWSEEPTMAASPSTDMQRSGRSDAWPTRPTGSLGPVAQPAFGSNEVS